MDVLIRDSREILLWNLDAVGLRNASRIWGLASKFVMLDRFGKTLGLAEVHPGLSVPRKIRSVKHFGTGLRVSRFLTN